MSKILPTTKAQVSGHKFLVRRMQHALVLGDISMIHDPLASRRRALIFGMVAVVLIALGSGLLAWLRP
ncbi:type VII secretion protein EccB, partial [Corynebacterium stationis]